MYTYVHLQQNTIDYVPVQIVSLYKVQISIDIMYKTCIWC